MNKDFINRIEGMIEGIEWCGENCNPQARALLNSKLIELRKIREDAMGDEHKAAEQCEKVIKLCQE